MEEKFCVMRHLQKAGGNINEQAQSQVKHSNEKPGPATPWRANEGAVGRGWGVGLVGGWVAEA